MYIHLGRLPLVHGGLDFCLFIHPSRPVELAPTIMICKAMSGEMKVNRRALDTLSEIIQSWETASLLTLLERSTSAILVSLHHYDRGWGLAGMNRKSAIFSSPKPLLCHAVLSYTNVKSISASTIKNFQVSVQKPSCPSSLLGGPSLYPLL
ncbi:predicted protein [Aspergillus nidulans FGSC A4]|uniref:Uncharacterized protein n=1 Tax=Emericella nidulans (strain FGSC A4 / ATCC 38163 / CBS 112.46 / NRRL 194 / M139) TaxID=227321 RepID=Q5B8B1_EMENI|nr:hypothetical protein [Aspergillus nidulans FGSC A4]EAA63120.1 predicted protein [Aspergillus nidulans FGSC A4]CBF83160.1 TPA: hypothetical protein ANIA_03219 [Aspergillus nidulans FGSC A4]|eukprot:XP_660823.1 predicted protein [Aspergillus nidulans FGSC A4]